MITVLLRGGLGNQMFQYAFGVSLSRKSGAPLVLDTTYLNDRFPRPGFTFRNFDLDIFAIEPKFTFLSRVSHEAPVPGLWLGMDLVAMNAAHMIGTRKIIFEKKEYVFDAAALVPEKNGTIYGYWQNERYFADEADAVKKEFRFKIPFEGAAAELAHSIAEMNSIALHVRRGDYLKAANMKRLAGATDVDYYGSAVQRIVRSVKDPHFFVFSDDIAWCRENMKIGYPTTYVDGASAGPKASFHLHLMSLAKHNIIANSTFSWWGAWLNANPDKIVIAPKRWLAGGVPSDIVPVRWITL
jgi:hypothetical protein